jgi:hypothetical protein
MIIDNDNSFLLFSHGWLPDTLAQRRPWFQRLSVPAISVYGKGLDLM